MSKQKNRNSLVHGVYSSDVVLPWERAEDFYELLEGIRLDFKPNGAAEDDIVFEIAVLHWKKRRINRALQLTFLENNSVAEIEKSGKRSVRGIRRFLKAQGVAQSREEEQFTAAVMSLSESVSSLAEVANQEKVSGKFQANLRSLISTIAELQPALDSHVKNEESAKSPVAGKFSAGSFGLDSIPHACEIEERLDALIEKKIKRLVVLREFQRQYGGHESIVKVIEQGPPHAHPPSPKRAGKKKSDADAGNADSDNDNNDQDKLVYGWQDEYDEAQAENARRDRG